MNQPKPAYPGSSPHVLLVDDEPHILLSFSTLLKSIGINFVSSIDDSRQVIPFLEKNTTDAIILDLAMPFIIGQELLIEIKQLYPHLPVIVVTAAHEIDTAVECMKNGASDYLVKPVEKNRFLSSIKQVLEVRRLQEEMSHLKKTMLSDRLSHPHAFAHIITTSPKMMAIFKYIEAIAPSPQPVTITGETGVGKELIARALHSCSRPGKEFVAVNAAGLDDTMFSDTLFGHKKGAFTGADHPRNGLIARASNGTVFLDEIGDLSPQSQIKLLRLVQENEYYPLGSDLPIKTNAHIIVATNQDLYQLMQNGLFRRDLYYRLSTHHIHIPPLKERPEDIPLLLHYFTQKSATSLHKNTPALPPQLTPLLLHFHFPGNVRQLQTMIYDAVSRHTSGPLPLDTFNQTINAQPSPPSPLTPSPLPNQHPLEQLFGKFPTLKEMEETLLTEALTRANNHQGTAAAFLGISRQALNKRLNRQKTFKQNNKTSLP